MDEKTTTDPVRDEKYSVDLEALRSTSRRGLPDFAATTTTLLQFLENRKERGVLMRFLRRLAERPRVATALAGCGLCAVLLFVPISYDKTVGHEVILEMPVSVLGEAAVEKIADDLGAVLGSEDVRIRLGTAKRSGISNHSITARVAGGSRDALERETAALAARLAGSGVDAAFAVSPIVERVRGNVYLAAASTIIHIRAEDEYASADEMADDIRSQLEAAGMTDPDVEVDMSGGCTRICVRATSGAGDGELPEIRCEAADGAEKDCLKLEVRRTPGMSDADLIAEIERQLAEQGHSGTVILDENGCPKIEMDD
jgi:hypothetical protein